MVIKGRGYCWFNLITSDSGWYQLLNSRGEIVHLFWTTRFPKWQCIRRAIRRVMELDKSQREEFAGEPDCIIQPWQYAGYLPDVQIDNTAKATCLWTGGGIVIPEKRMAPEPHRQDCFMATPSGERADDRAVTPMGFARAVFLANRLEVEASA